MERKKQNGLLLAALLLAWVLSSCVCHTSGAYAAAGGLITAAGEDNAAGGR